ncbi:MULTISPECIES: KTSC domain-containing protein [Bradyrhizobium]|uniref:KTSC domain-containing protein n=1 Tax=Bradyrhizobium yuanmingense TaxID=108015 RepID=A0A0R3BZ17_9BRAD|nr:MULTISPECIES: KTSC domain-containing protein [Bradyrhizobium]KRP90662.1 lysyl-tRNA synthetase [Bradyrhizobium yuanmingense]MCA1377978.1 KTSC domain-containing protein [Bradyrhizobium sp. IC4060]MCA1467541.1 KTSC domain-containing protein [Bradyrhizobium sp. IC3195]MCA1474436.1 KTSC domain-containing protein [Bradyrhizobium sp. NBAIM08]MCA1488217.1 KTSC domain-containing protein [Bradyrhizobium sp. IC4061]
MPSSVIRFFRYAPERRELKVTFVSGRLYVYEDVPPEIAAAFRDARAKGTFFNREIRDRYACRDITHELAG